MLRKQDSLACLELRHTNHFEDRDGETLVEVDQAGGGRGGSPTTLGYCCGLGWVYPAGSGWFVVTVVVDVVLERARVATALRFFLFTR